MSSSHPATARTPAAAQALIVLLVFALGLLPRPAEAAWPHDPAINVPVTVATGNQILATAVPDGSGGMFVAWQDNRAGNNDIYAQRISAAGLPLWTTNGVVVCSATGEQTAPDIIADGSGGVILTWMDSRSGQSDIYVQKLNTNGVAQWTANGVALCTATSYQSSPSLTSDGSGGAIVAWEDQRGGPTSDIYARRVNSAGTPQWTSNGIVVCNAADTQLDVEVVSDDTGGAFVAWRDYRTGTKADAYAQRLNSSGSVLGTANGNAVCTAANSRYGLVSSSDGFGGMLLAWFDSRGAAGYDVYVQRLNPSLASYWPTDGLAVSTATGDQYSASICPDASGGAIVVWRDNRGATEDIYAQHVTPAGNSLWTADGLAICTATGDQNAPQCAADGAGGAVIAWNDRRSGVYYDIYSQRVSGTGSALWGSNGIAVLAAGGSQDTPRVISDGAGGALIACEDLRSLSHRDLYCQRVERYGQLGNPEPAITAVKDVKNDQGGSVKVSWSASYLDADPTYGVFDYRLWRSVPTALAAQQALVRGVTEDPDEAAREDALLVLPMAASGYAWELAATQTADALTDYSLVTSTLSDSLPGSFPRTVFMVEARASSSISADRWYSAPDSGYSVDNLAPAAPAPLTGEYSAGQTRLHWNPNTEGDLAGYRLYRGSSIAFVPGPANFVGELPDTGATDAAGAPYVYKLTAVDVHGNESPVATLLPTGTLAVDGGPPARTFLALASGNPSRGTSTLRFALTTAGPAQLAVFDAAGRRVRTLFAGTLEAGEHAVRWDGDDEAGHATAAGLYFARFEAGGRSHHVRIVRAR